MLKTNTDIHNEITEEFKRSKRENTSRQHRMDFANRIVEDCLRDRGEVPNGAILQRLATLILHDEIRDPNAYKVKKYDYPILSTRQELRRRRGNGPKTKSLMGEISETALAEVAIDGRSYRPRTRTVNRKFREIFNI